MKLITILISYNATKNGKPRNKIEKMIYKIMKKSK